MSPVPDPVAVQARRRGGAPAVVTPGFAWTWRGLDDLVGAAAARLAAWAEPAEGGTRGLAVQAPTSPELVVLVLAALRAGVVAVPLSPRWPPAATAAALARLGLRRLVTDGAPPPGLDAVSLGDLLQPGAGAPAPAAPWSPGRAATVVHTSGSTGVPKAALHTVGNHVASARGVAARLGLRAGDRWWLDLPLDHVGGLGVVVRCVLAGAAVAMPGRGASLGEALAALRPTHASLVPTQLGRWLDAAERGEADLGSLRAVLVGGSAVAPALLDRAVALGVPVATSYGLTEMTATVTATPPGAPRAALATSGAALAGRALRFDADGQLWTRGASRFAGYLDGPLAAARPEGAGLSRPFDADGWLATGDVGHLDAAGRLVVTGRRDLQFVSGGENVQPEAIERVLLGHPAVAEAVVVPVADAAFGARPVAFVRTAGAPLDRALRAALDAAVRAALPGFMAPDAFWAWGGAAGLKADRPALRREAERRAAEERAQG